MFEIRCMIQCAILPEFRKGIICEIDVKFCVQLEGRINDRLMGYFDVRFDGQFEVKFDDSFEWKVDVKQCVRF